MLRYVIGISVITIIITLIRFLTDRKISRKYQYAMWLVIPAFMLLYPFVNVTVTLPFVPLPNNKAEFAVTYNGADADDDISFADHSSLVPIDSDNNSIAVIQQENNEINWEATFKITSLIVSGCIFTMLLLYNIGFIAYVARRRSLIRIDRKSGLKVYKIDIAATPFLLGRSIYIRDEDETFSRYILCHEVCHYRQGDRLWIILRYVVLVLNWYNPLIWASFVLSGIDCELACDERALIELGQEEASSYGNMLLELAKNHSAGSLNFTVSTGVKGAFVVMKKRITSIKRPHKNNRVILIISILIVSITAGCSLVEYASEESGVLTYNSEGELSTDERLFGEWLGESDGTDVVFRFWDNNTGSMTLVSYGYETTTEFTYSADGTYLTLYGDGFDGNRGSYAVGGDLLTIVHDGTLCLRRSVSIINAPSIGSLPDGLYTVTMTSNVIPDDRGNETCMFYPWTQYEVNQDFIDSLATGQSIDLTDWGGFGIITIQDISTEAQESENYIGTDYSGLRKSFTTDTTSFSFYQEEGSDKWNLFSSGYLPVMQQYEMMRMVIAEDCTIYDAYSFLHGDHPNMTPEEYEDVIQFRDTSLTEGVSNSISDFFDVFGYTQYDYTVIRVENNVVTEVYFWYI